MLTEFLLKSWICFSLSKAAVYVFHWKKYTCTKNRPWFFLQNWPIKDWIIHHFIVSSQKFYLGTRKGPYYTMTELTLWEMSVICSTLIGPSMVILTDRQPDPGISFCLVTCMCGGIRCSVSVGQGPKTATAWEARHDSPPKTCTQSTPTLEHSLPSYNKNKWYMFVCVFFYYY